ncbi:MAG: hypothetical protein CMO81_04615 [Waddliaceae bacterium]|nr:hypothetical protein [Waddliaceae bacterium]
MLTGYFTGVSGIYYNEQKLGVTANNLANSDTTGFRKALMLFRTREENEYTRMVDRDVQERNPKTYGIQRTGVYKAFNKTGSLKHTDNPMDLGIVPELKNAFFQVKKADPSDQRVFYSRDGRLSLGPMDPNNPEGPTALYTAGHLLLGDGGQPIQIDPSNGTLRISPDGVIYQNEEVTGEIPLYRFNKSPDPTRQEAANLQMLHQLGNSILQVPPEHNEEFNIRRLEVGKGGITRLMAQGSQEASNVNVMSEMAEMMHTTKAAEANQRALRRQVETLNRLVQLVKG